MIIFLPGKSGGSDNLDGVLNIIIGILIAICLGIVVVSLVSNYRTVGSWL